MLSLAHPLFKQLRDNIIQSKRFLSFTRGLSDNFPLSIAYNSVKILIQESYAIAKMTAQCPKHFPRSESSWNFRSRELSLPGTFRSRNLELLELSLPGTFAPWNFSLQERKFQELSLLGAKVPRTFAPWNYRSLSK